MLKKISGAGGWGTRGYRQTSRFSALLTHQFVGFAVVANCFAVIANFGPKGGSFRGWLP
jgi:hypothetical protein